MKIHQRDGIADFFQTNFSPPVAIPSTHADFILMTPRVIRTPQNNQEQIWTLSPTSRQSIPKGILWVPEHSWLGQAPSHPQTKRVFFLSNDHFLGWSLLQNGKKEAPNNLQCQKKAPRKSSTANSLPKEGLMRGFHLRFLPGGMATGAIVEGGRTRSFSRAFGTFSFQSWVLMGGI